MLLLMVMVAYWLWMQVIIAGDGKFLTAVGQEGKKHLKFSSPFGAALNHRNRKVYISDKENY